MTKEPETSKAAGPEQWSDPAWAWAPYVPDARRPWNLRLAGHLHRRAGFGANWTELREAVAAGPQKTIEGLLRPGSAGAAFDQTFAAAEGDIGRSESAEGLRAWWLMRMLQTPSPLVEKMTLFWHGHFAVTQARAESPSLMARYVKLLRSQALGRFDRLLESIAREPAVLLSLDGAANRRAGPSRHLAATLLGPFTLGEGVCSDRDVREAARAMTGQFVRRGELCFVEREHDPGVKRFLGQEGPWKTADIVRIILAQKVVARRLVGRLYRWLISEAETPKDSLLEPLAASFAADYDIGRLVETMLRSNLFFSPAVYRQRVKGPVEFAVGMLRPLEALVPTAPLAGQIAALGQDLYHPPTVDGWQGGRAWITRATMVGRSNLAQAIFSGAGMFGESVDPLAVAKKHDRAGRSEVAPLLLDLFLQGDVPAAVADQLSKAVSSPGDLGPKVRRMVCDIVKLPEFQLC